MFRLFVAMLIAIALGLLLAQVTGPAVYVPVQVFILIRGSLQNG